ncbi:MAG: tetratricopeptide repeat protein [bacterium]
MSKCKVKKKIITEKPSQGKPLRAKGWSFHQHGLVLLLGLFLMILTFATFGQVRTFDFINLDDNLYITENRHVQSGLTLEGVAWAFTTTRAGQWIPLTWLSHMLDCQLYGLNPSGHHLTNLVFHIASTLLLFLVLERMTGSLWRSGFVAALFALHPLHVESVAWAAERKDVLSTFFWMLTMWTYIRYVERPGFNRYLLVLLSFVLGLLSKPMLVTLPFVLLLLDYWPLGRFHFGRLSGDRESHTSKSSDTGDQKSIVLRLIREKAPFFVLCAISSILTIFAAQKTGALVSLESYTLGSRIANAPVSYVRYIEKMVWPRHLAVLYPYQEMLPIWKVLGSGLLLVCVSFLVIRAARKFPYHVVGWFWYLGTLIPVIGIVQAGPQALADRFTYVPLIGLFIMMVWGVPDILAGWRFRKVVLSISTGLLLSLLMIVTNLQLKHWQNDITLFERTLAATSNNFIIHNYLGAALAGQGKTQEAVAHYAEALRIKPGYAEAHNNLGVTLANQGKIQEAVAHYAEALRIKPDDAEAHNNLGAALAGQGKTQEAIAHFAEALRIKPDYADAHNNLGAALAGQGKIQEAIAHFAEAVRIKPDYAEAHNNLGAALAGQGKTQEAIAHFAEALRIKPDDAEAHKNLGFTLAGQGKTQEAVAHFAEALRIKPDYAEAHNNLGIVFLNQGKYQEATSQYKEALRINRNYAEAHYNLGNAYLMTGNRGLALKEYDILKTMNPGLANALYQKIK